MCVGPTHDDVTLKAIAHALGEEMVVNSEMVAFLEEVTSKEVIRKHPVSSIPYALTLIQPFNNSTIQQFNNSIIQ